MSYPEISRRRFLRQSAAAAATTGLLAGAGCAPEASHRQGPTPPKRIFLLTLDTLRADHMGCYGYPRLTTPFLDAVASEGVLFRDAITSCSHTNPAHVSLFSGLHLPQHKLLNNGPITFSERIYLLTDMLREAGYDTAAFCSARWLRVLDRGFNRFTTLEERAPGELAYRRASETVADAMAWLDTQPADARFFLWMHLFDPHVPYFPSREARREIATCWPQEREPMTAHWLVVQKKQPATVEWHNDLYAFTTTQNSYDAEVRFVDTECRRLYAHAQERGLAEDAWWIFTADHGEGLGGHYRLGHSETVYREAVHVPWLLYAPDDDAIVQPRKVDGPVQHVDLFPTLAELLGVPVERQVLPVAGDSLLPLLTEPDAAPPQRFCFSQRMRRFLQGYSTLWERGPVFCIYNGSFKYVVHADPKACDEFFHVAHDPLEQDNLIEEASPAKNLMRKKAWEIYDAMIAQAQGIEDTRDTGAHDEALDALGYL